MQNNMKLYRGLLLLAATAILAVTAGCDPQGEKPPTAVSSSASASVASSSEKPSSSTSGSKQEAPKSVEVELYYPDATATKLVSVKKKLDITKEDKYNAAVHALMQDPKEKNVTGIFPKTAKLRSVRLQGDIAVVDFDSNIRKGFSGGSTGERFLVGSVVNTLTNFPEIKKVRFLLDGKEIESLAGHMDLTEPVARMNSLME